ncbi:MAG: L,D-transpeptidase [Clostridia bacterium]|nr:L,D-transpeptidase [Clostridia bacterium]
MSDKSTVKICTALGGVVILLVINAFVTAYFTDPFTGGAGIDMGNLAQYTLSKSDHQTKDILPANVSDTSLVTGSDSRLQFPEYPYFIEVDKTNQVITVFTTGSGGKYDKPVRVMLCSTPANFKDFPDGYWTVTEPASSSKSIWHKIRSCGVTMYVQYSTYLTGNLMIHSVPYTESKNETLDQERYASLGSSDFGGCIRLTVENAKWISENCKAGTTVHLVANKKNASLTQALKEQIPKPDDSGWEPTDPDPDNPNYHPQYNEETPATEGYLIDNLGLDKIEYSKKTWIPK